MFSKKSLGILIVVIIAAAIIVTVIQVRQHGNSSTNYNSNTVATEITKSVVPNDKLPTKFPENIPLEAGATITDNYNATTADGRYQATRTFVTKQSLAANLQLYTNYLKTNGWTIQGTVDNLTYKMVVGRKGKQELEFAIDENSSSKVRTVTISLTELIK